MTLYLSGGSAWNHYLVHQLPDVPESQVPSTDWDARLRQQTASVVEQFDRLVERWQEVRS